MRIVILLVAPLEASNLVEAKDGFSGFYGKLCKFLKTCQSALLHGAK